MTVCSFLGAFVCLLFMFSAATRTQFSTKQSLQHEQRKYYEFVKGTETTKFLIFHEVCEFEFKIFKNRLALFLQSSYCKHSDPKHAPMCLDQGIEHLVSEYSWLNQNSLNWNKFVVMNAKFVV